MDSFDAVSFFLIHDLADKGYWTKNDIYYIYGLTRDAVVGDGSGMGDHDHAETVPEVLKQEIAKQVMALLDPQGTGRVTKEDWVAFSNKGGVLPDVGVGPGHHMDFELEYEKHHWNEYHRDQDPDVHIKHKEDIEHEILHHEHEIEETHSDAAGRKSAEKFRSPVNIQNIPQKYLHA